MFWVLVWVMFFFIDCVLAAEAINRLMTWMGDLCNDTAVYWRECRSKAFFN